ncbi:hypothetical protein CEXT_515711 [Caerostris extrusa]|uniref:Uncharacterized protein n=1 Tax=Caerostris extrusa TaxID=172846 RepID=A0AAV4MKD7_CAEEX|nr:hypothetical protein CEXT_515711 [Caerostris extrusa]
MQSRDDRQYDPFESRMRPKFTKEKPMQSRDDRQYDPFESRMRPKFTKEKPMQSRDGRQSDPFESRMRPKFTKEKSMQSDPFESRMRPKFTKEKSMQSDPFESRMRPKFTKEKSMQSRDDRQSDFTQLSLMEECNCPGECNNENHFAEFSSLRQDPRESRNRSDLQNELKYKNLNLKQALIPERTPITNYKYKTNENFTSDQTNKNNFKSNFHQTGPTNSPNGTNLHYESIKNASYPNRKERQIQADMSQFVYRTPTSSSKKICITFFNKYAQKNHPL